MAPPSSQRPLNRIFFRLLWLQLFIPLLVSSLVMIAIAAFYGGQDFRIQQLNLNKAVAYASANYLYNASNVLDILAMRADISTLDDFNLSSEVINQGYEYFDSFYLTDSAGIVESMTPYDRSALGVDVSQQSAFQMAMKNNGVTITPPFLSPRTGHLAVYLSKLTRNGKVVVGELKLDELQRLITQGAGYKQTSEVFITDHNGTLLAHPNHVLVAQQTNFGHLKIVQQAREGDLGLVSWEGGHLYMSVATTVETSGWVVVSQALVSKVFSPYYGPAFFYVLFSAATLILFLRLVGSQVKNLVVSPLSKLSKATSEIASGNYAVNPQIKLIPAAFSEIRSLITNFREMAQSIMAREKLLEHLATHDNLTDLPNRALFQKGIQEQIEEDGKTQQEFAVLFIDVDDFKSVNDAFGHTIGDQALEQIASMLLRIIGPEDLVGRVGGDEFAILLAGSSGVRNAHSIAEALLHQLNQPLQIAGHEIYLSASIGVSIFPQDGSNPDLLIQSADTAMYQTKREGKHGVKFYTGEMETLAQERHKLSTSLHHALEAQEFELLFQPIYDFQRHNIVGSEALLRWNSRQLGLVMPSQFIDLASDTGLILPIGEWVMASACAQNQAWAAQGLPDLTINVNIAERQIKFKDFRETVEQALQNSGMPPHLLRLELSENIFFQNLKMIERLMVDLKQMGVKLSLDDFGTGYTTLSCLTRIPFDEIKIDRSLSRNVTSEPRDAAIVRGIIRIGHDLGMQVVAEGIETRDQFHFYSDLGCDRMQGYLYSHPVSAAQYESLLKQKGAPGMVLRPAESLSVPSGRDQRG